MSSLLRILSVQMDANCCDVIGLMKADVDSFYCQKLLMALFSLL
jgi:hypothetical protein